MHYRQLGKTDIQVSTVAVGLWAVSDPRLWGEQEEADAINAIHTALDVGINFFDTAEGYGGGYSEEILGKALAEGKRDKAIIATKVSPNHISGKQIRERCAGSLRRLQTDMIDLYQLHWPVRDVRFEETMAEMQALRDEGKIRVIGVSNYGPRDSRTMLEIGRFESNQIPYNLLWRGYEKETQAIMIKEQVSLLPYSPIQQGLLAGKFEKPDDVPPGRQRTIHFSSEREMARHSHHGYEAETFAAINGVRAICERIGEPMAKVALAWLLHQPAVTSVLAGARNADQVRANAEAADLTLSDDIVQELNEVTDELKKLYDGHLDMWETESRAR